MKRRRRLGSALFAASCAAGLAACATRIEMGSPPPLDRLGALRAGASTEDDVSTTLGEPRGYGAARFDATTGRHRIWMYEHVVAAGSDVEITMLLVFLKDGNYDGYLWFGEALDIRKSPAPPAEGTQP